MKTNDIRAFREKHWRPNFGSLTVDEMEYVTQLITSRGAKRVLELGVASGLTGAVIIKCLAGLHKTGAEYTGVDLNRTFWADKTKETGYLIREASCRNVKVTVHLEKMGLYLHDIEAGGFDVAFIDANHRHPWPTLDTIVVLPLLAKNAVVIHHDLMLFTKNAYGIGPKVLFDQLAPEQKGFCPVEPNIAHMVVPEDIRDLGQALGHSLLLPWNLPQRIPYVHVLRIAAIIRKHYGEELLRHFNTAIERYY